jgi:uncharacterized membrane protein
MQSGRHNPVIQFCWLHAVIAMVAATLGGFWLLLGYRYSPENYSSCAITLDTVEFVWIGLALAAAVVTLVMLFPKREKWPVFVRSTIPLAVVSLVILAKSFLHAPLHCYDMILFCTAFGWGIVWLIDGNSRARSASPVDETKHVKFVGLAVWMSVLLLGSYYVWQQIRYLDNMALGYADCGEAARLVYNTLSNPRELFLRVNPDKPLFYDHVQVGVLPLAPLWALWPDLKLTILLQVLAVLGPSVPIYLLGKHLFSDRIAALLLVAAWLVYPSTSQFIYSGSYGFFWGNMCLLLYFIALSLWQRGRNGWALAAAIWALLIKEEAASVITLFGVYLTLFTRQRRAGIALTVASLGYFLLVTSVIIPKIGGHNSAMLRFFGDLGRDNREIFLSPLTKPRIFWGRLFEARSFYFAAALLAPLLFLPLKKPSILLVGLSTFVFDCLHPILKSISFRYQAALLPVVFWALAGALQTEDPLRRRGRLLGIVASGILFSTFLGNTFWSKDTVPPPLSPGRLLLVQQMGRHIDKSGSLFATQRVAAHFITQKYLYVDLPLPSSIDYVLLDLRDSWREIPDVSWLRGLCALQRQVAARPDLHLVDAEDGLLLYARRGVPLDPSTLVERDALPSDAMRTELNPAPGVKIVGFKVDLMPPPEGDTRLDLVRVTIFSAVTTLTNTDLAVRCTLQSHTIGAETDSFVSKPQPLGQGIWPIARWLPGKVYTDNFFISVPAGMRKNQFFIDIAAIPLTD